MACGKEAPVDVWLLAGQAPHVAFDLGQGSLRDVQVEIAVHDELQISP